MAKLFRNLEQTPGIYNSSSVDARWLRGVRVDNSLPLPAVPPDWYPSIVTGKGEMVGVGEDTNFLYNHRSNSNQHVLRYSVRIQLHIACKGVSVTAQVPSRWQQTRRLHPPRSRDDMVLIHEVRRSYPRTPLYYFEGVQ